MKKALFIFTLILAITAAKAQEISYSEYMERVFSNNIALTARNMDIENVDAGKRYPMTFAIDDEVYNVYFILYGKETIKVKGLGTVNTIKFAAKLLEGEVFKGEEDMMIWISDDENRLPVYFEAPLRVGLAAGRMSGYDGLKHPFTSLVNKKKK